MGGAMICPPEDLPRSERRRLTRLARRAAPLLRTRGPAAKGQKPFVVEVDHDHLRHFVAEEHQRAAAAMIHLSGQDLGLALPTVKWIVEVSPVLAGQAIEHGISETINLRRIDCKVLGTASEHYGIVRLNISGYRTNENLARTAAHEMRHHWQHAQPRRWTHEEAESDAEAYEEDALGRLEWRELAETMDARLVRLIFW